MRVLVSGGAGYIGSHTVVQLVAAGHDVLIVDNFANSKPTVVNRLEALTGTHLPVHSFDLTRPRQDRAPLRQRADRRRHPLRRAQGRRRERRAAARVLREQPRLDLLARPRDAPPRRRQARLQLLRHGLRHQPGRRSPRTCRPSATNPYGWTKVMQRADPARRRRGRPDACASPCCATSTRSARTPAAPSARTRRASPTTSCPTSPRSPSAGARSCSGLRRRLPDPGRHRRCATTSTSRTSPPGTSPRSTKLGTMDEPVGDVEPRHRPRHDACSRCCTPSSGRSAASCPTRSSAGAPATSP